MLVVTRKQGEAIVIGDGIEVRILRAWRDGVRLGITAPAHVGVHRREIYDEIRSANAAAATARLDPTGVDRLRLRAQRPGPRDSSNHDEKDKKE